MDAAHITALLEPFLDHPLPSFALKQISIYIDLLLRWNARINLTAVRNPDDIVTRHFGESFFLARHLFPNELVAPDALVRGARSSLIAGAPRDTAGAPLIAPFAMSGPPSHHPRVLDLGSGAGFPALPLKIWSPNIHLTLIESNHKKSTFLREAARSLTLTSVNVISERAETLATTNPAQADVVTLRAVENFDAILPIAIKFLAPSARLALLISSDQLPNPSPIIDWCPPISVPQSHSRVLVIGVHVP